MALAIVEADGLDLRKALKRPGEADGRILPAGKQHKRDVGGDSAQARRSIPCAGDIQANTHHRSHRRAR